MKKCCQLSEKLIKNYLYCMFFLICIVLIYCIYIYWFIMKHPIGFVSFSLVLKRGNLQDVFGNLQLVVFLCYFYQEINYDHGPNSLNGVNHSET